MTTIPHHATPATAYQLYVVDVATSGQRGAYARVGRQLGRSDETIRRWVHAHEAAQPADPLAYIPPPGGYEPPEPRELPQPPQEAATEPLVCRHDDTTDVPQIATEPAEPAPCMPQHMPQDATPERRAVIRRPMPQRYPQSGNPVRWWRTVHPQVWAWAIAAILVIVAFPH